jgi:hypothetical protein
MIGVDTAAGLVLSLADRHSCAEAGSVNKMRRIGGRTLKGGKAAAGWLRRGGMR